MNYENMTKIELIRKLMLYEEQFKNTFEQIAVGIAHVDLNGQFIKVNRHFCGITGYSEQEILKSTFHNITYPDDIYMQNQIRKKVLDGEKSSYTIEKRYIKKDNSLIWVNLTVTLIREPGGEPHYFISIIKNITKRKKVEEHVRKLTHAIEQSSSTIVITDIEGNIEYVNPRFSQLTGYTREEVIGQNPRVLKSSKTPPEVYKELWETLTSGNEWRGEFCNKKKNGELYYEFASISSVKNDEGTITNFVAVKEDITERKKIEETLLQTEKLRAMGMMTSGIAHDFNNILAIISGHTQLLEGNYKDDKELTDSILTIAKAAEDGAGIVRRMRQFTKMRRDTSTFVLVNIKEVLEVAIGFLKPRWMNIAVASGKPFDVDMDGIKEVPSILGNPSELREVFINMINNAMDAMSEGGRLSFRTWTEEDTVFVRITDTGCGMSEEVKKRIFDPFFTIKRAEGSGLGMSEVYGIVTGHGGKIDVSSEVGKGTILTLKFPIGTETIQEKVLPEPAQKITAKKLRILVVDDEKDICNILNLFFSRDGHDVKTVTSGKEAIDLIKSEEYDLVLCDLVMPDSSGYEVVQALDELDKRPKVGLITGWEEDIENKGKEELNVDFIIKKPFDFSELTKNINNVINE